MPVVEVVIVLVLMVVQQQTGSILFFGCCCDSQGVKVSTLQLLLQLLVLLTKIEVAETVTVIALAP